MKPNELLLGMESLMIHNSNHDDNTNDKSRSDDGLEIESNALWMKNEETAYSILRNTGALDSVCFLGLYTNIK